MTNKKQKIVLPKQKQKKVVEIAKKEPFTMVEHT